MSWVPAYHQRNLGNLDNLAPNTRAQAMKWYQYCVDNTIDVLIYETIRTVAQQRENMAKGASKTMKSYHLVGQALDFVPIADGKAQWSKSAYSKFPFYAAIQYAEKLGFEAGYRWGWDAPHLQYNYKGYGTDKVRTVAAAAPINVMSKEETLTLQEKLTKLGLDTNGVDGIYGKGTTNAVMILQRRTGLAIDGIAGKNTLAKIDELLKQKSLIGTPGTFRVFIGTFGTPEAAEEAAKKVGFNAFKGENENRVYTGVFTSLESAEEARALIEAEHGYNPKIKSYSA
ncbi:peptidoglycan-binding protein [Domibacillus sp. PGB-M46]|uniref:peptidoglycan-binding protein n=1 Tax=Domibacillus sp. PGB-M46 TaxID=2910255 RepID=UPI001F586471|nr:peptidoglycan-binding protein [Domibacillus sp. PGB-M46]MCI2256502.1 peptidoglycan-binding protein [Domibacillus sp. PGB-M46]